MMLPKQGAKIMKRCKSHQVGEGEEMKNINKSTFETANVEEKLTKCFRTKHMNTIDAKRRRCVL
jgi:hypothetical protein